MMATETVFSFGIRAALPLYGDDWRIYLSGCSAPFDILRGMLDGASLLHAMRRMRERSRQRAAQGRVACRCACCGGVAQPAHPHGALDAGARMARH